MEKEGGGREGAEQVFEVGSGSRMVYIGVYEGGARRKTKGKGRNKGMGI